MKFDRVFVVSIVVLLVVGGYSIFVVNSISSDFERIIAQIREAVDYFEVIVRYGALRPEAIEAIEELTCNFTAWPCNSSSHVQLAGQVAEKANITFSEAYELTRAIMRLRALADQGNLICTLMWNKAFPQHRRPIMTES